MATIDPVHNLRITGTRPLISPGELSDELPLTAANLETVVRGRETVAAILDGTDDRLLVVVGPCSIHDPVAALDYAQRLAEVARRARGRHRDRDARATSRSRARRSGGRV